MTYSKKPSHTMVYQVAGNPLAGKRALAPSQPPRAALGSINPNTRHNSVSADLPAKEQLLKPLEIIKK